MNEIHLLEEYLTILPIRPTIEKYGDYKSLLKKQGLLIDDFDLLIGCTAVHNKLIMVTENVKHLSRIPNILIENWIQDKEILKYYTFGRLMSVRSPHAEEKIPYGKGVNNNAYCQVLTMPIVRPL